MWVGKKKIIEMALSHPSVEKIVEGIVRTEMRSDYRDLMVDTFCEFFTRVATALMEENIGHKFDEDIVVKSRITFSGICELKDTTGMGNKILTILCKDDNFKFSIGTGDDSWIIIHNFSVNDDDNLRGVDLLMHVFYSDDEKENERIDEVLKVLRRYRDN